MTKFSESCLILLVCLVLLPRGHTITTIDNLNMTKHGFHPGCVPGTYQAIFISQAPTHLNAHNCAQNYPQNARKSKHLVNLYNFGSAQLNTNQLGCAAAYFESKMLVRRLGGGPCRWETQPWHTTPNFWGETLDTTINLMKRLIEQNDWYSLGVGRPRHNFPSVFDARPSFRAKGLCGADQNHNFTSVFDDRPSFREKGLCSAIVRGNRPRLKERRDIL